MRSFIAALALLTACGGGGVVPTDNTNTTTNNNVVASVAINPSSVSPLTVGGTTTLTATAKNSLGQDLGTAITWTSSNTSVASVVAGVVTANAAGTAQITAAAGTISASVTITVNAATATVKTVTVSLATGTLAVAATTLATATVLDQNNAPLTATVTWTSSANNIATVAANGLVTAVAAGTATITATASGISGSATLTVTAPVTVNGETLATLPQTFLNTAAPPAPDAGGQVISVSTSTAFQNALNTANYGDVIALANGVTFTGNFVLANRGATNNGKWITIRPATLTGMPAEGSRMTPTIAAVVKLPIILSPNNAGAIITSPGAHHWRMTGIEVSQVSTVASNTGLVRLGEDGTNPQVTLASVPHDIVVDRSWIHGLATPNINTRRCVGLNSGSSAVIDSYLSDCHENGADAQAIAGWNGPGPFKIVNNYLEASGENIMFGGADASVPNLTPSDIEIRKNHFFKPASWKSLPVGQRWLVKNLFELKHAQRVLVEGNIFENNWTDGQAGTAIAMKTVNQSGGCTWCVTQDVTFRFNLIRNVGGGFTFSGSPDNNFADIPARRITIVDNIVHTINTSFFDGIGQGVLLNGDVTDLVFAHNTIIDPTSAAVSFGGSTSQPMIRLSLRDNIIGGGVSGVKGSGIAAGTATVTALAPSAKFVGNVITLTSSTGYPTGNFYPAATTAISFSALASFDFHLLATSPFKAKASDGTDPGANVDAVLSATTGVIVP